MPRYHYTLCGLDNIYVKNADFETVDEDGVSIEIPGLRLLHTIIAMALLFRRSALSGLEFKFLRREFDMSLEDWVSLVGRDSVVISSWEAGGFSFPRDLDLKIRKKFLLKLYDRRDHFFKCDVDIRNDVEKVRISVESLEAVEKAGSEKTNWNFSGDLPVRVLLNAAGREIEISHDGGGLYHYDFEVV